MSLSSTGLRLAADAAIDLHLHTTYSDGRWTLEPLLDYLLGERFGLAAITDHDRADTAVAIQQMALDKGLPVLVAVEMSTTWQGEMTDLLCYGFDPNQSALNDLAQDLLHRQQENTREVFENLQRKGYALPDDALLKILASPSSVHAFALASLLRDHGYGLADDFGKSPRGKLFRKNPRGEPPAGKIVMGAGCMFETNDPAAIVEAAHQSGAVCLLAHPGRGGGFMTYDVQSLNELRQEVPIDGLEVYYPFHTSAQTAMYREYARRHHLLVSAGSDSHRPERPPIQYRAELCRDLLERLGIQVA
jgi:hypothetical protein